MRNATRRGLMGGAAALIGAPDIAPAATRPNGRESSPDAALIALCAEFVALEMAERLIYNGPDSTIDDEAAAAAAQPGKDRKEVLVALMDAPRASTAEGIQARAHALAAHNWEMVYSFDQDESVTGRLLGYLMRDATALLPASASLGGGAG